MAGGGRQQYSDSELLFHLRRLAAELGRAPSKNEVNGAPGPAVYTYQSRFGSFGAAVRRAGLEPNVGGGRALWTRESALAALRQYIAAHDGVVPSCRALGRTPGMPCENTLRRLFGSSYSAVIEAGGRHRRVRPGTRTSGMDSKLQTKYGISEATFHSRLAAQGGGCAICGGQQVAGRRLAVDHDHQTGAVRDLLCNRCNAGLGSFQDHPRLLRAAAAYIERHALKSA